MSIIKANGITLYYELHGPAGAPVLVLNNGILMGTSGRVQHDRVGLSGQTAVTGA